MRFAKRVMTVPSGPNLLIQSLWAAKLGAKMGPPSLERRGFSQLLERGDILSNPSEPTGFRDLATRGMVCRLNVNEVLTWSQEICRDPVLGMSMLAINFRDAEKSFAEDLARHVGYALNERLPSFTIIHDKRRFPAFHAVASGEIPHYPPLDAEVGQVLEMATALWVRADGWHDEAKAVLSLFLQFYRALHHELGSLINSLREEDGGGDRIAPMFRSEVDLLLEWPVAGQAGA